tara:strand:+ start:67 stop:312 length:246 start_codon:yes stop_codon:yes gene_type:complete
MHYAHFARRRGKHAKSSASLRDYGKGRQKKFLEFYSQFFDWRVDDDNPMNYCVVDTHSEGASIGGGVAGDGHYPNVVVYAG